MVGEQQGWASANPQPSCSGPLLGSCQRWERLKASSDPAPGHPRQPVWLAHWEGWHQDQGDPRGEGRDTTPREPHRPVVRRVLGFWHPIPWGALNLGSPSLGYDSSQTWPLFSACRRQVPRCRSQGTCSPIPQSVPSRCLGCLMPSSCACARSALLSWRCCPGAGGGARGGAWACLVRP